MKTIQNIIDRSVYNQVKRTIINENKLIVRSPSSLIIVTQKNTNKKGVGGLTTTEGSSDGQRGDYRSQMVFLFLKLNHKNNLRIFRFIASTFRYNKLFFFL